MNSGPRERASTREEEEAPELQSSPTIAGEPRAPIRADRMHQSISHRDARSHAPDDRTARQSRSRLRVDHDLAKRRSTLREIAIGAKARSRSTLREINVNRDLAKHRAVEPSRASIAISLLVELASRASIVDDFFPGFCPCFSGFVSSFFFSKHQKIFFGKFFEMQPNT